MTSIQVPLNVNGSEAGMAPAERERPRSNEFAATLAQQCGTPLFSPWPPVLAQARPDEPAAQQTSIAKAPERHRREGRQRSR